jgi:hypothetical protein
MKDLLTRLAVFAAGWHPMNLRSLMLAPVK